MKTLAFGLLLLAACSPRYDDDDTLRDVSGLSPTYDGDTVRIVGRHLTQADGSSVLSWPGTTIKTRFTGSSITVALAILEGKKENYFQVVLDGADSNQLVIDSNQTSYTLQADGEGPHELSLVKLSEAMDSVVAFAGFTPAQGGALLPTARPNGRRIMFIGDSITCGYGNLGSIETIMLTSEPDEGQKSLRDCNYFLQKKVYQVSSAYAAYSTVTARDMDAEWQLISWSGKGIYRNADGATTDTIPDIWRRAVATDGNTTFAPGDFVPQAVVINLGTNDFGSIADSGKNGGGPPNLPLFRSRYVTLVKQVRTAYPSAWIYLATGPMLSDYYPKSFKALSAMNIAIKEIVDTLGDGRVKTMEFPLNISTNNDATGCEWHPNAAQDANMAGRLVPLLKKSLQWK